MKNPLRLPSGDYRVLDPDEPIPPEVLEYDAWLKEQKAADAKERDDALADAGPEVFDEDNEGIFD